MIGAAVNPVLFAAVLAAHSYPCTSERYRRCFTRSAEAQAHAASSPVAQSTLPWQSSITASFAEPGLRCGVFRSVIHFMRRSSIRCLCLYLSRSRSRPLRPCRVRPRQLR